MYKHKYHKYKQKYMDKKEEQISLSIKDPHLFNIQLGKKNVEGTATPSEGGGLQYVGVR